MNGSRHHAWSSPLALVFRLESFLLEGAPRGSLREIGWLWERMGDTLGVRAALAVAKVVEKGRVEGLGATLGVLWCDGKAWEGRGVVDGAFGRNGMKSFGIHLIFVTCCHVLDSFVPLTVKYHITAHLFK